MWVVLAIVVVGAGLYFVATTLFGPGEPLQPAGEPMASPLPQDRELTAADLHAAVFPVAVRGYRMSDVDAMLERLAAQLEQQEQALRELGAPDRRPPDSDAEPSPRPEGYAPTEPGRPADW